MRNIFDNIPLATLIGIFASLSLFYLISMFFRKSSPFSCYAGYMWWFFLILLISEYFSFYLSTWGWGILSFFALREFFSLVDIRLQDRLGILAAYFSIPFMMHFIHTDWYNMFIITIPVYSFLVIPFLISIMSNDSKGAIYSIGTIDFGLFLFVYCIGHLAYLSFYSTWLAAMFILNIIICDVIALIVENRIDRLNRQILYKYIFSFPLTVALTYILKDWNGVPDHHAIIIGLMIPALVIIGNHTIKYFESDLGIIKDNLRPGRGLIIDNFKSILYTAPIILHYFRYFIK